jgi:hypothetical protein
MSEGFLSRWSRRKQAAVKGEEPPPEPAAEIPPQPPGEAAVAPPPAFVPPEAIAKPPEPEVDLAALPPVETLTAASDFRVFLKPGVPAALRNAALRKAWIADPLIRDHVSSLDYGWDFNAPDSMPGFSLDLGETGERLRKLIAQAVGERGAEEEAPAEPLAKVARAEAEPEPTELESDPPEHLTEALPPAPPEPATAVALAPEAEPAQALRRHGGARPT